MAKSKISFDTVRDIGLKLSGVEEALPMDRQHSRFAETCLLVLPFTGRLSRTLLRFAFPSKTGRL